MRSVQQLLRARDLRVELHPPGHHLVLHLGVVFEHEVGALGPVHDPQLRGVPAEIPPEGGILPDEVVGEGAADGVEVAEPLAKQPVALQTPQPAAKGERVQVVRPDVPVHVKVPRVGVPRRGQEVAVVVRGRIVHAGKVARDILVLRAHNFPQGAARARQAGQDPNPVAPG